MGNSLAREGRCGREGRCRWAGGAAAVVGGARFGSLAIVISAGGFHHSTEYPSSESCRQYPRLLDEEAPVDVSPFAGGSPHRRNNLPSPVAKLQSLDPTPTLKENNQSISSNLSSRLLSFFHRTSSAFPPRALSLPQQPLAHGMPALNLESC